MHMKKLVVLGGGYGGMTLLQRLLAKRLPEGHSLLLIDRTPYHWLKTEFYALAAGTISDHHIRVPFPESPQLEYLCGHVVKIDLDNRLVHLKDQEPVKYDELVIALGCEDRYHQVPGAKEHTHSIQTIEAARAAYQAIHNLSPKGKVAIVGAGLSGVELASELCESRPDLEVFLFDRSKRILSAFPERLSNYVESWFREHRIHLVREANITKVEEGVLYNRGEPEDFDVIVWTAGIQANKIVRDLDVEKDGGGRVLLTPHHTIPNYDNVFVCGDCASLPFAPSAQLAERQAEQIADVLLKRWAGEPLPPELPRIKLKGILGSLGKKHGFGLVADRPITGRVPRLLKSGVLWLYKFHNG